MAESKEEIDPTQRFKFTKQLADTLQGRIYLAIDKTNGKLCVVKETWKQLVAKGVTRDNHKVPEDFHMEKKILNYLSTRKDVDPGFVRMITEWEEPECFYYAMEFAAGGELFDYVKKTMTSKETVNILRNAAKNGGGVSEKPTKWQTNVQSYFKQLVQCVAWMHQSGVCHLDLSLENTMIGDEEKTQLKIIDFGVGKFYPEKRFKHNKRVGKTGYMAPETYQSAKTGRPYDARQADVWCLGVMLFMMLVGAPPYDVPSTRNPAFKFIINGRIADVLKHWKRLPLLTKDSLDLLQKIFKPEKDRISMIDILKHPYVQLDSKVQAYQSAIDEHVQLIDLQKQKQVEKEPKSNKVNEIPKETPKLTTYTTDEANKFSTETKKASNLDQCKKLLQSLQTAINNHANQKQDESREAGSVQTTVTNVDKIIKELKSVEKTLASKIHELDSNLTQHEQPAISHQGGNRSRHKATAH